MIRLTRAHLQPIGIDIGHDGIKMLQVETVGQSLSVVAACRRAFGDDVRQNPEGCMSAAGEMIRQMLRQGGFGGRRAVAALPRHLVQIKNLRLPPMPAAETAQAVRFEARNLFDLDVEQATIHQLVAGEVRQGDEVRQELIVLAARNADVAAFLEQLHACGLVVESLDAEPLALFRSVERFVRRKQDESEVHVLVDIGAVRSQVLIGKGGQITFYKPIDIAGRQLSEAVSKKLKISVADAWALRRRLMSDAEARPGSGDPVRRAVFDATRGILEELGRELALCLRYYTVTFRGQRPHRVRLVGGEACDGQLRSVLAGALSIPVETGRPLYSVDTSRLPPAERQGFMCQWATALGLTLRLTTGKFAPRDGRPRDLTPLPDEQESAADSAADVLLGAPAPLSAAGEACHA